MAPTTFQGSTPPPSAEGIVTPEAVLLEFNIAGVGSRAAGAFIDYLIRLTVLVVLVGVGAFVSTAGGISGWISVAFVAIVIFMVTIGYDVFFETIWNGRSPGKALFGLRVLTDEGAPIRFRHAAIRGIVGIFEIYTLTIVAPTVAFFSKRSKRLGDMAAGTIVVRQRQAQRSTSATTFGVPAVAEDFTASLDVTLISPEEYGNLRSFLVRAPQMTAASREKVSTQLARQFVTQTRSEPPAWMTPENFLTCVATAYQRRFKRPTVS